MSPLFGTKTSDIILTFLEGRVYGTRLNGIRIQNQNIVLIAKWKSKFKCILITTYRVGHALQSCLLIDPSAPIYYPAIYGSRLDNMYYNEKIGKSNRRPFEAPAMIECKRERRIYDVK